MRKTKILFITFNVGINLNKKTGIKNNKKILTKNVKYSKILLFEILTKAIAPAKVFIYMAFTFFRTFKSDGSFESIKCNFVCKVIK